MIRQAYFEKPVMIFTWVYSKFSDYAIVRGCLSEWNERNAFTKRFDILFNLVKILPRSASVLPISLHKMSRLIQLKLFNPLIANFFIFFIFVTSHKNVVVFPFSPLPFILSLSLFLSPFRSSNTVRSRNKFRSNLAVFSKSPFLYLYSYFTSKRDKPLKSLCYLSLCHESLALLRNIKQRIIWFLIFMEYVLHCNFHALQTEIIHPLNGCSNSSEALI